MVTLTDRNELAVTLWSRDWSRSLEIKVHPLLEQAPRMMLDGVTKLLSLIFPSVT